MLNSGRLYNLPALKINARRITNATSLSICHNHVQYILCSSGVICVLSLFSKQQRTRDHWTDVKDIFYGTYTLTCAALNICGEIKMCAWQTKCRRSVDPLKASLRSAASSSEWVKVSGRRRFRRKHKGREGGSFPVKIDKEIRIYALQLWTFLGISFWVFFPETERLEQSGYQTGNSACQSEQLVIILEWIKASPLPCLCLE